MLTRRRNNRGPYNPPLRVAGNFSSSGPQSLSIANNSTIETGNVDWWASGWYRSTANTGEYVNFFHKATGTQEFFISKRQAGNLCQLSMWNTSGVETQLLGGAMAPNVLINWMAGYNATTGQQFIIINAGTPTAGAFVGTPRATSSALTINAAGIGTYSSVLGPVMFGKNPPGGFATTPAATIAAALYNGGRPLDPRRVSIEQRTAWGGVSAWISNDLKTDVWGTNTLTPNNAPRTVQVLS